MGYGEQFFFSLMREHGLIVNGRTAGWSYSLQTDPYKEYIDKGWFVVRPNLPHRRRHPFTGKMEVKQSSTTLITNLGWLNLYRMYGEHGTHWNSSLPEENTVLVAELESHLRPVVTTTAGTEMRCGFLEGHVGKQTDGYGPTTARRSTCRLDSAELEGGPTARFGTESTQRAGLPISPCF